MSSLQIQYCNVPWPQIRKRSGKNILVSGNIEGGMGIYNTFLEFQDHELCSKYIHEFYSWLLDNKRLQLKTTDFPKLA